MNDVDGPKVIAAFLRKKDVAGDPKVKNVQWPVYTNHLGDDPNDPSSAIAIFENAVPTQGRIHRTGQTISQIGFQVRIRAEFPGDAKQKILEIEKTFDEVKNVTLIVEDSKYLIQGVHRVMGAAPMGQDKNNRENFSINYQASIRKV